MLGNFFNWSPQNNQNAFDPGIDRPNIPLPPGGGDFGHTPPSDGPGLYGHGTIWENFGSPANPPNPSGGILPAPSQNLANLKPGALMDFSKAPDAQDMNYQNTYQDIHRFMADGSFSPEEGSAMLDQLHRQRIRDLNNAQDTRPISADGQPVPSQFLHPLSSGGTGLQGGVSNDNQSTNKLQNNPAPFPSDDSFINKVDYLRQQNQNIYNGIGQQTVSLGKDLGAATMLGATGALKNASLGYLDLTPDARRAGELIGASPQVTQNPWLADVAGFAGGVASGEGVFNAAGQVTNGLAQAALTGGLLSGLSRRTGDLTLDHQLDLHGRARDAAIGAAGSSLTTLADHFPAFRPVIAQKLQLLSGSENPIHEVHLDDFLNRVKNTNNLTSEETAFLTGKSQVLPETSPYYREYNSQLWSPGKTNNQILNAMKHSFDHSANMGYGAVGRFQLSPEYLQAAHDFSDNIPNGTYFKPSQSGYRFLYETPSPSQDNIFGAYLPDGSPKTFYNVPKSKADYLNSQPGNQYLQTDDNFHTIWRNK